MIVFLQLIVDHRAVFAVNHENGFFDLDSLDFISENGKWVETKLFQIAKPLRVHDAGITIRG